MGGKERESADVRACRRVLYCIVPREIADKLHDPLRRHFADQPEIEVVVEQRFRDRRGSADRRARQGEAATGEERRAIRNAAGRRIADRRAPHVPVADAPPLPRKLRRHADQLAFLERLEPAGEHAEDVETARLVTRIQAGDDGSFSELYVRWFDRVYGYVRVLIRDAHEAEDLTQQIFIDLIEAIPRYERRGKPFRAWLFTVVRNRARMHLRSRRRLEVTDPQAIERDRDEEQEASDPGLSSLDWISDGELLMFVERLPDAQRQVLVMRYLLGLSSTEIATAIDANPEAVRQMQSRATRTLEKRLVSVGRRAPVRGRRATMKAGVRQAPVLRHRRFALH